jgi:hypothetical protein
VGVFLSQCGRTSVGRADLPRTPRAGRGRDEPVVSVLAPSGAEPRAADTQIGLTSGVATIPLPADWQPLGRRSSLPGLEEATAVRAVHSEIALDIRAPEDESLLPAGVEDAVAGDLPEPRARRLDSRTAWRYDLPPASPGTRVVALALPTTGGIVTIACAASPEAIGRAGAECERAAQSVQLDGASALAPTPETAAAIALPDAAARLNRRRTVERRRLAATRSPRRRRAAAGRGAACRRDDRAGRTAPRFAAGGRDRAAGASLSGCAHSRAIAWTMSPYRRPRGPFPGRPTLLRGRCRRATPLPMQRDRANCREGRT